MPTNTYWATGKKLFYFSLLIIFGHIGQMLIQIGDLMVAGQYATDTLAAVSIASGISAPIFMIGLGFIIAQGPLMAQKWGQQQNLQRDLASYLLFSLILATITQGIIVIFSYFLLPKFSFEPHLIPLIQKYLVAFGFSFFGAYSFQMLKEYLQAQNQVLVANLLSLLAVVANLGLNFLFTFGYGPIPAGGILGLAYASIIVRTLMALALFFFLPHRLELIWHGRHFHWQKLCWGLPVALSIFIEVLAFSFSSILVGLIDSIQAAAHGIVLSLASLSFMVPLSIASALASKVGQLFGAQNFTAIKMWINSALFLSLLTMGLWALVFFCLPHLIISFYTSEIAVALWAQKLLMIVAIFQLADGLQVTLAGGLRGLAITKEVTFINFLGYWIIAIPLGSYLAFERHWDATGIWLGLALGVFLVASSLWWLTHSRHFSILSKSSPAQIEAQ